MPEHFVPERAPQGSWPETRVEADVSDRSRVHSGSPYEEKYGFCRAVRVGDRIIVAGTAPIAEGGGPQPGGPGAQTRRCFEIAVRAIEELGGSAADCVRTRMFITSPDLSDEVGRVHGEFFGAAPPAATMVVAQLLDPEWFVEIEVEAIVG